MGEGEVIKGGKEGESPYLQNCKMESEELKKKKVGEDTDLEEYFSGDKQTDLKKKWHLFVNISVLRAEGEEKREPNI